MAHRITISDQLHARLQAAAKKYGYAVSVIVSRTLEAEVVRIERIPTHAPPATQRVLDERAAAQELRSLLDDDGNVVGSL